MNLRNIFLFEKKYFSCNKCNNPCVFTDNFSKNISLLVNLVSHWRVSKGSQQLSALKQLILSNVALVALHILRYFGLANSRSPCRSSNVETTALLDDSDHEILCRHQ